MGNDIRQFVAQRQTAAEYEPIATIALKSEDPSFHGLIRRDAVGTAETAHRCIEKAKRVRHAIRGWRVYCPELIESGFGKMRLLGGQHCFAKYLHLLRVVVGPNHNFNQFFEVEQPIR